MAHKSNASHTGSALSIVDILTVLYFKVLNLPQKQNLEFDRDRFILSKGHASAALYATLAEKGIIDKKLLNGYYCDDGILPGHVDYKSVKGLDASAGSLGHGLSIGIGMAIAMNHDSIKKHVYVLCGDGELNEGQCWEAIMYAGNAGLRNLTLIVDRNKFQGYNETEKVISMNPLSDKLSAFGWNICEINGHNYSEIESALRFRDKSKPTVVIAKTVKGKGVSFMENEFVWHYKSPNDSELKTALEELN